MCGGATCSRRPAANPFPAPPPVNWEATPTLEQITTAINRTSVVTQLSTNTATIDVTSMPQVPKLSATVNIQREKDFRLKANLPLLLGQGLDMGSNQSVFWFEVPERLGKTLYYARHDQYQQQLSRSILPVSPAFVTDALGLVQVNPASVIEGPTIQPDGKIRIRTSNLTPVGPYQRVLLVDRSAGFVTDQMVYDPSNQLVAQSTATNHVYYDAQQVILPHRVQLSLKPTVGEPLAMQIDISSYIVNQLLSSDPQLFTMPTGASQSVDLAGAGASGVLPGGGNSIPSGSNPTIRDSTVSNQLSAAWPTSGPTKPNAGDTYAPISSGPTAYAADASLATPLRGTKR